MKEKVLNCLKPTLGKTVLTLGFLGWQYGYSFLGLRLNIITQYGKYLPKLFSGVDWNNYFVRNFSLFLVWVAVALVIFAVIWIFQVISVALYNRKIKKDYINAPEEEYSRLLKTKNKYFEHLKSKIFWFAGILIIFIALFAISDLLEQIRFFVLDSIVWNAHESGATIDMYSAPYTIGSFVVLGFIWYFISAFIIWVFTEQKTKEQEEEIAEKHFAIKVDTGLFGENKED
jgi:hypothetical protein